MATPKQIAANRLNALKSTGPRSEEGKSVTRLNAMRAGLTGQVTTLSDEDRPIFEKLKSALIADLAHKTVMELNLAASIAWDTWRLNHLRAAEMNMYALGANNTDIEIHCTDPQLHTATLRELQAERKQDHGRDRDEEIILARYSDIKGLPYQTPTTPNGSVYANNEIFAAANRLTTLEVAKIALRLEPYKVQFAGASASAPSNVLNWPEPNAA